MPIEPNPYDRPDLLDLRKGQEDPIILYIVVRESLNMGSGKIGAQIGHGVGMFVGRYHELADGLDHQLWAKDFVEEATRKVLITHDWLHSSYRKAVLKADDKEWEKLKQELDVFLVKDAGLTEVDPGSETVLVLWPMRKSERPKLVKRLQAL
jgi:PTH2 family peptidyl-tRNA hydrolase